MDPHTDQFWATGMAAAMKTAAERVLESLNSGQKFLLAAEDDFRATSAIMRQIVERIDRDRAAEQGERPARAA